MLDLHPTFERATSDAVAHFAPLIEVIAAIAHGDDTRRAEVEFLLPQIDNNGWIIQAAVEQIWAGERDFAQLSAGLDTNSAAIVQAILVAASQTPDPEEARLSKLIGEWRPIILTVAAAYFGVQHAYTDLDGFLPQLEAQTQWQTLAQRIRLLVAGDSNRQRLLADLDTTDSVIMQAIFHALDDKTTTLRLIREERDRAAAQEEANEQQHA
ncbi:hypothetical protein [Herpetosiphon geysericola]|uniref:Uncharacterized protein n=1 Tax=Herpetosiphon geysericola TaxID=70996 RepID=A0A0P6Y6B0_9CHLR|nr:hypothetical protein [Herpetosiphon geysericola]KPL91909.1 hypothetical protein SE18_00705 [Herpetosiphon geysericola]